MRQLYNKLKDLIHNIAGKYFGPWDYILLRDTAHPENIYKVYVTDGELHSCPVSDEDNDEETEEP